MPRRGRGEGYVERLPSGAWRAVLSAGHTPEGKRLRLTATRPTKQKALAWLRSRQAEQADGGVAASGLMTVAEWLTRWLAGKATEVESGTHEEYGQLVRNHLTPTIGHVRLSRLQPAHVRAMYQSLAKAGVSAAMQRKIGGALRAALGDAVRMRHLARNVALDVPRPKAPRPRMQCWDAAEVRAFVQACSGDRLAALFVVALDTGMRRGELLGLSWSEVAGGTVSVLYSLSESKKGCLARKDVKTPSSRRRIALSNAAIAALDAHRQRLAIKGRNVTTGPVFSDADGGWLRASNMLRRHFRPLVARAGVRSIRFHDLRHTHATLALAAGANLRAVSARLGHASAAFTLATYAHALPEQDEQIAAAWNGLLGDCPTPAPRCPNCGRAIRTQEETR